jgi:ferredoxin
MPRTVRTTVFTTRELGLGAATPREGKSNLATFQVTFVTEGQERTIPVSDDVYLLDAATGAGLDLPFSCLQGWCTTCAGRILEGKVDQTEARRVFPQDEAAGFVLLCSAYARSDLRIVTHQKEVMRAFRRSQGLPAPRG